MSPATPDGLRQIRGYCQANLPVERQADYDITIEGTTPGHDLQAAAALIRPYAEAGATWWLEAMWDEPDLDRVLGRIRLEPPR